MKVRKYVEDDEFFLANYADGLTDLPLTTMTDYFGRHQKTACFLGVKPTASYHMVSSGRDGIVTDVRSTSLSSGRINGGFFMFNRSIFDHILEGEELVERPFRRLIEKQELLTYSYDGFWACMDTFKEKQHLDELSARGTAPWEVWKKVQHTEFSTHGSGQISAVEEGALSRGALGRY
jgi:glucose-1-phosphate cytidylyltransferase